MRGLLWFFLVLLAVIGLSIFAGNNDGYVLIVRPPYRFELSFNLLIALMLLGFFLLYLLLRAFDYARRLPASVKAYKEEQRRRAGRSALRDALHTLAAGHYQAAEKSAARALELGEDAGLSALLAARAAHKARRQPQRDFYLAEAERLAPQTALARLLLQAELLLDDRQYQRALQVLQQLQRIEADHAPALRLALKIELHLGHWPQVLALLQQLEKQEALEFWQIKQYRQQAYVQMFARCGDDLGQLHETWKKLPVAEQHNPRIAQAAARAFIAAGDGSQASRVVEASLAGHWDGALAELLGDCVSGDAMGQLQRAEYWLTQQPNDAGLLLSLGKMCLRQQLWGKAQSYLEASIGIRPGAAAHHVLATVLEARGEQQAALHHYRQSARLAQAHRSS